MTLGGGIGVRTKIIKVILIMVNFIRQMKLGIYCNRPTENTTFEQRAATSALEKRMIDGGFTRSTCASVV